MINIYSKETTFSHGNHKILHISVTKQFSIMQLKADLLDGTEKFDIFYEHRRITR